MPNDVSCSGDAFLRHRRRSPDDMTYKGSFTLQSQKTGISVDRVFLHLYLEFMYVAITDRAQVAQNESSLQIKSSYSSKFHISIVSWATGVCIQFLSGAKFSYRYSRPILLYIASAQCSIYMQLSGAIKYPLRMA